MLDANSAYYELAVKKSEFLYILRDGFPERASIIDWTQWIQNSFAQRLIDCHYIKRNGKKYKISTVFTGVDISPIGSDEILLWETVVFDEQGKNIYDRRYYSPTHAKEGHKIIRRTFGTKQWKLQ